MSKMRFIGDIHGKFEEYLGLLDPVVPSIQVGDFGIGFAENPVDRYDTSKDLFFRGNHDNPNACHAEPNFIPDGVFAMEVFCIGGAQSTDRHLRNKDIDWWEDEELTQEEFYNVGSVFVETCPRIVATHDCPERVRYPMLGYYDNRPSRTQQTLSQLWGFHKPALWVFGHYHKPFDEVIDGTRFICLDINQTIDIELEDYL